MTIETALRRTMAELSEPPCRFALVGGLAVSARTEPRFTRDVDLAVAVAGDDEAEALTHRLRTAGCRIDALLEQQAADRLAAVRLRFSPPHHATPVDLLFASSGIEPDIVHRAEVLELVPGLTAPVAATGHLVALKVLSRDDMTRPQDLVDLRALLRAAADSDLELARAALAAITARGFHRGRDLVAALDNLLRA